jgi:hypothetical protein
MDLRPSEDCTNRLCWHADPLLRLKCPHHPSGRRTEDTDSERKHGMSTRVLEVTLLAAMVIAVALALVQLLSE